MLLSATNLVNIPEKRKVFNQKIILFSILFHSKFFTLYIISKFFTLYIILYVVQKMSEAEAVLPPHPELYKNQLIFGNDYFTNILVALRTPFFCSTLITNEPLSGFFTSTPWRLK